MTSLFFSFGLKEVVDILDARIFLRVPCDVLKKRRSERSGYATAGKSSFPTITLLRRDPNLHTRPPSPNCVCLALGEQMNSEGEFWKDPPGYFEQLVYPAYIAAHRAMFAVCTCPLPPIFICMLTQVTGR